MSINVLMIVPDSLTRPFGGMGVLAKGLQEQIIKFSDINLLILSTDSEIASLPFNHMTGTRDGIVCSLLNQAELIGRVAKHGFKPDIVHCFDWCTSWAGLVISKLYSCKLIYHVQLALRHAITNVPDGYAELAVRSIEDAELTTMNYADLIIQVSESYAKAYSKFFNYKTLVLHNGINLQEWENAGDYKLPGDRKLKVVYIGRYARMKNISSLLQAKIPRNMDLIFVGSEEGGDISIFKNMLAVVDSRDELHYIGPKYNEEKVAIMQSADFIIVPSSHEPFGIVALEAMAAKTQLICSMQGGLSEFANHPFVINCGITSESISAALEQASKMTQEQININTDKAFEHVKNWTWEKQSEKLVQIYRFLAAHKN